MDTNEYGEVIPPETNDGPPAADPDQRRRGTQAVLALLFLIAALLTFPALVTPLALLTVIGSGVWLAFQQWQQWVERARHPSPRHVRRRRP